MKRILSLCIILILSFQLISIPIASAASDEEVNLIFDLGIVERPVKSGLFPKTYTRGDFAKSLDLMDSNAVGDFRVETAEQEKRATDIFGNDNYIHIAQALEVGYMSVDGKGAFNPGGRLTLSDAQKALVKILGYGEHARQRGDDESAYTYVANKLGLLKGIRINDSQALSYEEVAELIANAMQISFFSEGNVDLGGLCFFDLWNLVKKEGKIYANSNLGIVVGKTEEGYVNIGGEVYYTKLIIEDSLIGAEVIYYTTNGTNDEEVVSITVKKALESVTLNSNKLETVVKSGNVITLKDAENEKYQIPTNGYLLINGKTMSPAVALFEDFKNNSGTLTLLDTDNNGSFDLVNMTIVFQDIIEGVNVADNLIITRFSKKAIDVREIDSSVFYLNQSTVDISELKEGMLIGIASDSFVIEGGHIKLDAGGNILYDYSPNKTKLLKLYASSKKVSGILEGTAEDKVYINDTEYELGNAYYLRVSKGDILPLKLGQYINAYVDYFGQIAYYETDNEKNSMSYGYLIKSYCGTEGLKKVFSAKILEQDGNIATYSADKKVIIDGKSMKLSEIDNTEMARLKNRTVIRYKVIDNVLKEIDTSSALRTGESKDNSLTEDLPFKKDEDGQSAKKIHYNVVDRKYAIGAECIVFVDEATIGEEGDDAEFSVGTTSSLGTEPYIAGYDVNKNNEISCVVKYSAYGVPSGASVKTPSRFKASNRSSLVEKVLGGRNENGDEGYWLHVVNYDGEEKYFVNEATAKLFVSESKDNWNDWSVGKIDQYTVTRKETSSFMTEIGRGDTVLFTTNSNGEINYIERVFDLSAHLTGNMPVLYPVPNKGGQTYGFVKAEKQIGEFLTYSVLNETFMFRLTTGNTTVPVYYISDKTAELVKIDQLPTASSGRDAYVFTRFYDYGYCYDQIFYVLD